MGALTPRGIDPRAFRRSMLRLDVIHRAVEAVDREVARLAAHASLEDASRLDDFRTSWGRLVDVLELGPLVGSSTGGTGETDPPLPRSIT
jgi:hypothetical protein